MRKLDGQSSKVAKLILPEISENEKENEAKKVEQEAITELSDDIEIIDNAQDILQVQNSTEMLPMFMEIQQENQIEPQLVLDKRKVEIMEVTSFVEVFNSSLVDQLNIGSTFAFVYKKANEEIHEEPAIESFDFIEMTEKEEKNEIIVESTEQQEIMKEDELIHEDHTQIDFQDDASDFSDDQNNSKEESEDESK